MCACYISIYIYIYLLISFVCLTWFSAAVCCRAEASNRLVRPRLREITSHRHICKLVILRWQALVFKRTNSRVACETTDAPSKSMRQRGQVEARKGKARGQRQEEQSARTTARHECIICIYMYLFRHPAQTDMYYTLVLHQLAEVWLPALDCPSPKASTVFSDDAAMTPIQRTY
jgi:hypothetical protein